MANIRRPDNKEGLPPESDTRSGRLRDLVSGGEFAGNNIVLIYWSPEDGGRWVMWEGPDPLQEGNVTVGAPEPEEPGDG